MENLVVGIFAPTVGKLNKYLKRSIIIDLNRSSSLSTKIHHLYQACPAKKNNKSFPN